MEDGHTKGDSLFESDQLSQTDCDRISGVLVKIADEGRIAISGEAFEKLMN